MRKRLGLSLSPRRHLMEKTSQVMESTQPFRPRRRCLGAELLKQRQRHGVVHLCVPEMEEHLQRLRDCLTGLQLHASVLLTLSVSRCQTLTIPILSRSCVSSTLLFIPDLEEEKKGKRILIVHVRIQSEGMERITIRPKGHQSLTEPHLYA